MDKRAVLINPADNVAVVAQPAQKGDSLLIVGGSGQVAAGEEISTGHKIAIKEIKKDGMIMKYGIPIGKAASDIHVGDWVHIHNVEDITEELCQKYTKEYRERGKMEWDGR